MSQALRPSLQVIAYLRRLAPEPRRAMQRALLDLRAGAGDVRELEGNLAGYHRLRIGKHRVIFSYARDGAIEAVFAEERSLVYEVFEAEFIRRLKE